MDKSQSTDQSQAINSEFTASQSQFNKSSFPFKNLQMDPRSFTPPNCVEFLNKMSLSEPMQRLEVSGDNSSKLQEHAFGFKNDQMVSGFKQEEQSKIPQADSSLENIILSALSFESEEQLDEIFTMYCDPKQNGKIILNEAQFDLVKKVYTRCNIDNKFSLNDNQMIMQFFMNLKALRQRVERQE